MANNNCFVHCDKYLFESARRKVIEENGQMVTPVYYFPNEQVDKKGRKKMKVKQDFVTNSSSTSFVVWGQSFELYDLKDRIFEACKDKLNLESVEDMDDDIGAIVEHWLGDSKLSFDISYYDDILTIGICPEVMGEDQTKREFKEKIVEEFNKLGIETEYKDIHWVEECRFDG